MSNMRNIFFSTIIVLLSILIVCGGMFLAELLSKPKGLSAQNEVVLYLTEDGSLSGLEKAITVPLRADPLYDYKDPAVQSGGEFSVGVFEVHFDIHDMNKPAAVFFSSRYELAEVRLNGRLLKAQSPTDPQGTLSGFGPTAYVFPSEFLVAGDNELLIKSSGRTYKALPLFFVGDATEILRAVGWGEFFAFDLVVASTGMMIFVILMCALVDWPASDRRKMKLLILLLVSWSLRNLSILGVFDSLPLLLLRVTTYSLSYLPLVVLAHFSVVWTGWDIGLWRKRIFGFLYCLVFLTPIFVVVFNLRRINGLSIPWALDNVLTFSMAIIWITAFSIYLSKGRRKDTVEVTIFLVCGFALIIDKIDNIFHVSFPFMNNLYLTFYFAPLCGLLLGLGMCASIASQATRARRAVMNVNQTLEKKLAEREQEIRSQAKNVAIVEERRRIMQDMHDGLGARLSGIVLRTRAKTMPYQDVPNAVQGSLDELRLIIDSLDSAGDTLAIALGAFRERIEGQFIAAGIHLNWKIDKAATKAGYNANTILQIFRIMQEASSNIIRHSSATEVTISLRKNMETEGFLYEISIQDNGIGFRKSDKSPNFGKGMASIHSRAKKISADIEVLSSQEGVLVKLLLPRPSEYIS